MMENHLLKSVWILTDGKAGDLVQCRGVAAYLSGVKIEERIVRPGWRGAIPFPFIGLPSDQKLEAAGSPLTPPYPDLVIATGRRTVPYLTTIRLRSQKTKIVFLKDPKWIGSAVSNLIWIPHHDRTTASGDNIIRTHTSPHAFSRKRLDGLRQEAEKRFDTAGKTVTAIILGGNSKSVTWSKKGAVAFADQLQQLNKTDKVVVTASRRTPQLLRDAVSQALANHDCWIWDEHGDNPYPHMLATAQNIIVTGDSHNMVSEALASGACVYVHRPKGLKKKLHRFLDAMEAQGAIANMENGLAHFPPKRVDATPEIAKAVKALFTPT